MKFIENCENNVVFLDNIFTIFKEKIDGKEDAYDVYVCAYTGNTALIAVDLNLLAAEELVWNLVLFLEDDSFIAYKTYVQWQKEFGKNES